MVCTAGTAAPIVQFTVRGDGAGTTATTAAAATVTCTGMETLTPIPLKVMVPLYVPAALKDVVLTVTDKLALFDALTLKLTAESPIHDWLAAAVSDTAAVDVVLN